VYASVELHSYDHFRFIGMRFVLVK